MWNIPDLVALCNIFPEKVQEKFPLKEKSSLIKKMRDGFIQEKNNNEKEERGTG
jgi:hypothetical protein